jgi:hypothetical protein
VAKGKDKSGRLSVFKGREAKLNRAIFHILALKGPQTIYDIHKQIRMHQGLKYTKYSSVNKRVRFLEDLDYVRNAYSKKTKAGFKALTYDLTVKSYIAIFLSSINLEGLLNRLDESSGNTILATVLSAIE